MKWSLSGKFDLKDLIPATSGSTLNPTKKSATISQNIERSKKQENISVKRNREDTPTNVTVYITLKKVMILKVSLENKTITKIKTTAKTLLKISCPVIVAYFHLWDDMNNINVSRYQLLCNGKICTKKSCHFHCILFNEEDFPSERYFKRHLTQMHFNKAYCVRFKYIACLPLQK